jgi:hypothetical protein
MSNKTPLLELDGHGDISPPLFYSGHHESNHFKTNKEILDPETSKFNAPLAAQQSFGPLVDFLEEESEDTLRQLGLPLNDSGQLLKALMFVLLENLLQI